MKLFHFIPSGKVHPDSSKPTKIKALLPDWYKNAEKYFLVNTDSVNFEQAGLRSCLPFLDAMTSGFTLVSPCDIEFKKDEEGKLNLYWDSKLEAQPVSIRDYASGKTIPRPLGYSDVHYTWNNQWGWEVPRGYSVLVTHPCNRFELPFLTMSAVVDSDKFTSNGNIPFFLQKDFTGIIPAGTPIAQLIPIKRESWVHVHNKQRVKAAHILGSVTQIIPQYYAKHLRQKKEYK